MSGLGGIRGPGVKAGEGVSGLHAAALAPGRYAGHCRRRPGPAVAPGPAPRQRRAPCLDGARHRVELVAAVARPSGPAVRVVGLCQRLNADRSRLVRIVFVSLVDCLDEQQAVDAIALPLNVTARHLLQRIMAALAGQPALLVLDNFKQLVACAQDLLVSLLETLPALHLLVTSRQHLGLAGEQVFALGGLPLPELDARPHSAALDPDRPRRRPACKALPCRTGSATSVPSTASKLTSCVARAGCCAWPWARRAPRRCGSAAAA